MPCHRFVAPYNLFYFFLFALPNSHQIWHSSFSFFMYYQSKMPYLASMFCTGVLLHLHIRTCSCALGFGVCIHSLGHVLYLHIQAKVNHHLNPQKQSVISPQSTNGELLKVPNSASKMTFSLCGFHLCTMWTSCFSSFIILRGKRWTFGNVTPIYRRCHAVP